jgi:hypothetical protein
MTPGMMIDKSKSKFTGIDGNRHQATPEADQPLTEIGEKPKEYP